MTVYVLLVGVWPDDDLIEGVFSTYDLARAVADREFEGQYSWDIIEVALDTERRAVYF